MWRSCKRYPSFNSSLRFYQANSGPVCFSVDFDFERKKQVNPAKLLAFHARCPAAGHGISGSYNVQPQNREKRAPSRLTLMRTALFWYAVPNKAPVLSHLWPGIFLFLLHPWNDQHTFLWRSRAWCTLPKAAGMLRSKPHHYQSGLAIPSGCTQLSSSPAHIKLPLCISARPGFVWVC